MADSDSKLPEMVLTLNRGNFQVADRDRIAKELRRKGFALPDAPLCLDYYGNTAELSKELLDLIGNGIKRAGTSLLWEHQAEKEPVPQVGDWAVIMSFSGEPRFITRETSVEVVPFDAVTAEYAAKEGEGDKSLRHWREAHWSYFSEVCERLGRSPARNMPVVCCTFEVLHEIPSGLIDGE